MDFNEFTQMGFLVPIITGIISAIKGFGIPKKYRSILAIVLGIILSYFFIENVEVKDRILIGIVMGLSSSGLYSGTKNVTQGLRAGRQKRK